MSFQTSSDDDQAAEIAAAIVNHPQYRDVLLALDHRKRMVEQMTRHCTAMRLDVTEEFVNRHYDWFFRYYTGVIARGYLMKRTGAKLKEFGAK